MHYRIIFSIAIHDSCESALSLINNVFKFVPESAIVMHVRAGFHCNFNAQLSNVFINPVHYKTGYMDGSLLLVHWSNLKYCTDIGHTSDFISFVGSNEMFVRNGLLNFISNNIFFPPLGDSADYHVQMSQNDIDFLSLIQKKGLRLKKCSPEGTYYSTSRFVGILNDPDVNNYIKGWEKYFRHSVYYYYRMTFSVLARVVLKYTPGLLRYYPRRFKKFGYAAEEVFFPTFLTNAQEYSNTDDGYCFFNWENGLNVTLDDIESIKSGFLLNKFSVKRIPRKVSELRSYIDNL